MSVILLTSCTAGTQPESITTKHDSVQAIAAKEKVISVTPEIDSTNNSIQSLQKWVETQLADVAKDTSNYLHIKVTVDRTCCNSVTCWYFNGRSDLKYYSSIADTDGTSYNYRCFFNQNKLAGGFENIGAEDYGGRTFFKADQDAKGVVEEEEILSDTIKYLTIDAIMRKVEDIENAKDILIESLKEIPANKWTEKEEEFVTEITKSISDHENEKVKYSISKVLFHALITPRQN